MNVDYKCFPLVKLSIWGKMLDLNTSCRNGHAIIICLGGKCVLDYDPTLSVATGSVFQTKINDINKIQTIFYWLCMLFG